MFASQLITTFTLLLASTALAAPVSPHRGINRPGDIETRDGPEHRGGRNPDILGRDGYKHRGDGRNPDIFGRDGYKHRGGRNPDIFGRDEPKHRGERLEHRWCTPETCNTYTGYITVSDGYGDRLGYVANNLLKDVGVFANVSNYTASALEVTFQADLTGTRAAENLTFGLTNDTTHLPMGSAGFNWLAVVESINNEVFNTNTNLMPNSSNYAFLSLTNFPDSAPTATHNGSTTAWNFTTATTTTPSQSAPVPSASSSSSPYPTDDAPIQLESCVWSYNPQFEEFNLNWYNAPGQLVPLYAAIADNALVFTGNLTAFGEAFGFEASPVQLGFEQVAEISATS